jgi:hypothetical protein
VRAVRGRAADRVRAVRVRAVRVRVRVRAVRVRAVRVRAVRVRVRAASDLCFGEGGGVDEQRRLLAVAAQHVGDTVVRPTLDHLNWRGWEQLAVDHRVRLGVGRGLDRDERRDEPGGVHRREAGQLVGMARQVGREGVCRLQRLGERLHRGHISRLGDGRMEEAGALRRDEVHGDALATS